MDTQILNERLLLACRWLTDVAQVKNEELYPTETRVHHHKTWSGAMRGEYRVSNREWGFFCPVWHTGQAVKALVMASEFVGDFALESARAGGDFILRQVVTEGQDKGLILAYEDDGDQVNTSAILEGLDGLFALSEATGDASYREAALGALDWVARRMYMDGKGWFRDCYNPATGAFPPARYGTEGRPLMDDAVFLTGYRLTGDERFKKIAIETAERLLKDEEPAGNWIGYAPCNRECGNIHPRHAFWWGYPLLAVYRETGDERFREAFLRSVEWYRRAMRRDGGIFRGTYSDFSTDSFGHATSGVGCAVMMFLDAAALTDSPELLPSAELGLQYCMNLQFTCPADPWLKGVILEKILPPHDGWQRKGGDESPYHIRDLGTTFFVQAAARYLSASKGVPPRAKKSA
jgi:rhamnogalacturonyl hydrolase YesR